MSNQAVVNWGEFVRILENCRYQVAEREVTAFWEKYDEQTENSQKQIEFCNEAIRNDMAKVSALLVGVEEEKRKYIAPILHMAEGQILINTMFGVFKNVHDGQQNQCVDKKHLLRLLRSGTMSIADSGTKSAVRVSFTVLVK